VTRGAWTLRVTGKNVVDGVFDIWLPTLEEVTEKTAFLSPSADITLTLPSSAGKVISVGGYDHNTGAAAAFSGRGFTRGGMAKPDLAAPAVNIRACAPGGGYANFTGTSAAAPFVSGSAALMMQWGIVQGNDPYLYGERVKAFLTRGAHRAPNVKYPDNKWGYGTLCVKNSMDLLKEYNK
jgi:subtilisin family serine protease